MPIVGHLSVRSNLLMTAQFNRTAQSALIALFSGSR